MAPGWPWGGELHSQTRQRGVRFTQPNGAGPANRVGEAGLRGARAGRGDKHASPCQGSLCNGGWQSRRGGSRGGGTQEEPRTPQSPRSPRPGPAHLLMYSAFSSFPQVLHLKQPRCQCLSSATRDRPFLISAPQPPQPGGKRGTQPCHRGPRGPPDTPKVVRGPRGEDRGDRPAGCACGTLLHGWCTCAGNKSPRRPLRGRALAVRSRGREPEAPPARG